MNHKTIARLDILLGRGLCLLLTLHRYVVEALGGRPHTGGPVQRILFIKLIEQGATVIAYDAIRLAIERVGRANVFFCVFAENRAILDVMDVIPPENVLVVRRDDLRTFLVDAWQTITAIRRARIDTAIDMEFFARSSAILAYLAGIPRRVGLHRFTEEGPYRGDLMTHRVIYNPFLHVGRAYRLLVEAIDSDPTDLPMGKIGTSATAAPLPTFVPTNAEQAEVRRVVDEVTGQRPLGPIVLLNPNAGDLIPLRKWPFESFAELGRRLLAERPDVTLLVTGSAPEAADADRLCQRIGSPRAHSLAGRFTLREMMVLYSMADLLVTNDSGPGHFSSLTRIDRIILFGPSSPHQYGPLGERHTVLSANLACSPCVNVYNHRISPCRNNLCMQMISVDEVLAAANATLADRSRRLAEVDVPVAAGALLG